MFWQGVAHAGVDGGLHYFATKEEMLRFALAHWLSLSVHERFTKRVEARVSRDAAGTEPVAVLRAVAAEYLQYDEPSRFDARVAIAFVSRAAVDSTLAGALAPAFAGFVDTLRAVLERANPKLDAPVEAQRLAALLDGLRTPVLLGAIPHDEALAMVDRHLAQLAA